MSGRITIYSIAGCPHCLAAKKRLTTENFPFIDVRVDRFPASVRQWVQDKTGKTSVPQIFFNAKYVGGNKELQEALDNPDARSELLEVLKGEAKDDELPLLPNPGDAIDDEESKVDIKLETDKLYHVIEKLTSKMMAGNNYHKEDSCLKKMFGSPVKYSIPGDVLITFIKEQVQDEDAEKVAQHLLESRFLRKADGDGGDWSNDSLYVVTGLESRADTNSLNTQQMSSSVLSSPSLMSQQIRNILLHLFSTFLSEDGSSVDYKGISTSKLFEQFKLLSVELQRVDINSMTRDDKVAFFINIYNALVIHAHVEKGVPTNTYARYKFFSTMSYNIGGYSLTLNEIENGILRSNRAAMATLYRKPFKPSDPKMNIILPEVEPRIHFALNCGAKSCPPIKTFSGDDISGQLDVASAAFLENDDALYISEDRSEVRLTQLFQWYRPDFGSTDTEILQWILQHVTLQDKKEALQQVLDKNSFKLSYTPYDWGHNSKD